MSREHHFVPRFFLAGFTLSGSKKDQVWESDVESGWQRPKKLKDVASRSDFYRVSAPGVDPAAVEKGLSQIETKAAPLIKQVAETSTLPTDPAEREALFFFLGMLAIRVPTERPRIREYRERLKAEMETLAGWEAGCRRRGIPSNYIAYAELKDAVENESNQNTYVLVMIKGAEIMNRALMGRRWRVLTSSAGRLVCSDRPVSFLESEPFGRILTSSAVARSDASIVVPLTRYVALHGEWGSGRDSTRELAYGGAAKINNWSIRNADRYIFSAEDAFIWYSRDGSIHTGMNGLERERVNSPEATVPDVK
jgi:hypothetical protein